MAQTNKLKARMAAMETRLNFIIEVLQSHEDIFKALFKDIGVEQEDGQDGISEGSGEPSSQGGED